MPDPEETERANPIIARAQERGWTSPVHAARLLRCIDDKQPMPGHIEVDWNDFVAATPEQVDQARVALKRMAVSEETQVADEYDAETAVVWAFESLKDKPETNDQRRQRIRLNYFLDGPTEEARRLLMTDFDEWLEEHDAALHAATLNSELRVGLSESEMRREES